MLASGSALAAPAPLPPQKPKAMQALAATRMAPLRSAPLPPRRPAELDGQEETEEATQPETERAEEATGSPDRPSHEPAAPRPRLAARTPLPEAVERAAPPPTPPERPDPAATAPPAPGPAEMPAACAALMGEGVMAASLEPGIAATGACGLPQPVRLTGVRLESGRMVALKPAAVFRCEVAVAFTAWLRETLAPAVAELGSEMSAVRIAASYDCRPRNRVAGAKMSEHGIGNAVDVGGFEMVDGRAILVEKGGLPQPFRTTMRESACSRFTTVLGPGSDGYHEDHIHVDLAQRRGGYRMCQWNLDAGSAVAARKDAVPDDRKARDGTAEGGKGQDGKASAARSSPDGKAGGASRRSGDAKSPGDSKTSGDAKSSGNATASDSGKSSEGARSSEGAKSSRDARTSRDVPTSSEAKPSARSSAKPSAGDKADGRPSPPAAAASRAKPKSDPKAGSAQAPAGGTPNGESAGKDGAGTDKPAAR
ncbi:extensin family protein [Xanthobacter sp. KR7-65]|uniref:extensin family protein n=1 Tax=Xanthobacter sp. KR7-65 TaxID=3156612 RepID=UPI0032B4BDDE